MATELALAAALALSWLVGVGALATASDLADGRPLGVERLHLNIALFVVNHLLIAPAILALLVPMARVRDAWNTEPISPWVALPPAFMAYECAVYWAHRAFHRVHRLRPLHAWHHEAREPVWHDALRVHPGEFALTMLAGNSLAIALLGSSSAPPLAVVFVLRAVSAWVHSGASIHLGGLGRVLATPAAHALHHRDARFNLGGALTLFDALFGTFRDVRADAHGGEHEGPSADCDSTPTRIEVEGASKERITLRDRRDQSASPWRNHPPAGVRNTQSLEPSSQSSR